MIFHKTKRITSAVILLIFLVSDLARAGLPIEGNAVGATQELSLEIPAELGSVQETFLPAPNADAPFVIHLETPHAHYESVLKIKEIIQYLRKRYKVDLVFAEGASKALHPEFLRFFDDSGLNQKMLDALAQKGELTGVDLALGMPPHTGFASAALPHSQTCAKDGNDLTVVGIENPDFYRAAYHAFKKVIENLDQSQTLLDQAKAKLDQKASKIFPRELRDLVATWQKFSSGQRNVVAAAKFLAEKSKESIRLDFEDPLSQFEWPQLTRLVLLTELEKKFDKNALEKEKEKLTRWLREKKISSTSPFSLSPEGRGLGESESPRRHYERFLSEVYPKGFRFADYPQLTYFAASRVLKSELEASRLFPEFDRLFDKLFEAGTKTDEERKLIEEYKQLLLIQKLLRLELTREEWKKIKSKNRENFFPPEPSGPKKTLQLFRYRGGENPAGIFLQGTGWGEEIFSANVLSALRFYRLTERREAIFLKNLSNEMEKRHVKKAILVTGGFHTEGLTELFKKEGIGFANLTPHITGEIDSSLYHQIMLRRAHLEKPLLPQEAKAIYPQMGSEDILQYFRSESGNVGETERQISGEINPDSAYFKDRQRFVTRGTKNDHPPTAKELERSAAIVQETVENRIIGQNEFNRFVDQLEQQQELNGKSGEGGHKRAEMRSPKGTADTKSSIEEQGGEGKKSPRSEVRIENSIGIRILGGTEPGASSFLFWDDDTHLLLDAGLEAGSARRTPLFENLPSLDAILLSHGHLDHTGALPIAVSLRPEAHVYTTWPTAEIATSLFWETLNFLRREGRRGNSLEVLRDPGAVRRTIERILPIEEEKWYSLKGETKVRFIPASHIVGADLIEIASPRARFLYTGDFSDEDIQGATSIRLPEEPVDFLVMEATYGDRLHGGDRKSREEQLAATVARVIKAGGSVLIPSATIGRATNIVSVIRHYQDQDSPEVPSDERIPSVPVYVEGSAAFHLDLQDRYWKGSEKEHELIFGPESTVKFVAPPMSKAIEEGKIQGPYIIVGGHGMLAGGAAALHLKHLGTHKENAVILVGYQAPDSLGASLLRGEKEVRVNGKTVQIKAEVIAHPLSAHADQKGLVWLAKRVSRTGEPPTKIFLIHGDEKAKEALREALQGEGITNVAIPDTGDSFEFDLPQQSLQAERKQSFDHIEAVPFPLEKEKRNPPRVPYVKEDNPVYPDARLSIIQTLLRRLGKVSNGVNREIVSRYLQTFEGKETKDGLNEAAQAVEERLPRDVSKPEARQRENAFWQKLVNSYGAGLIPAERLPSVINETNQKRPQPSRKSPEQKYQENLDYFTGKFVDAFRSETAQPQEEEIRRVVGNFLDKHRENGNLKSGAIAREISNYLNPNPDPSKLSQLSRIKHTAEDWRRAWKELSGSVSRSEARGEEGKIIGEGGHASRRSIDRWPQRLSSAQLDQTSRRRLLSSVTHLPSKGEAPMPKGRASQRQSPPRLESALQRPRTSLLRVRQPQRTLAYPLWSGQETHGVHEIMVQTLSPPSRSKLGIGGELVSMATPLAGPGRAYEFVAAIGTVGVGPEKWDLAGRYQRYLRTVTTQSVLRGRDPKTFLRESRLLQNPSLDGVGIRPELRSKETNTPITLLIDSRALNPKDRSEIRSRLETLPEGSIVTEYVNQEGPASVDILSPLMHEFPMLKYSRQVYRDQIKMDQIREALLDRGSNPAMRQHTAILFSSLEGLENLELENLGIAAFQFDAARVTERYRSLPGLSAAVFGEVAEYAKLGRELNERTLHENQALGLFGFRNGVYSFLESWFDARTSEQLVSASA